MFSAIGSRLLILIFGILYPAYASYKAVKIKNAKENIKWLIYWIVFAFFTTAETFTDIFLSWIPFYYEVKILLLFWLIWPATRGASYFYRKFLHPTLSNREQEIDEYIAKAKEKSYRQVLELGQRAASVLMQTALKGGGGIVSHIKRSYSLSDVVDFSTEPNRHFHDTTSDEKYQKTAEIRLKKGRRSLSSDIATSSLYLEGSEEMHFMQTSLEDITSGYGSNDSIFTGDGTQMTTIPVIRRANRNDDGRFQSKTIRMSRPIDKSLPVIDGSEDDDDDVYNTNIIFNPYPNYETNTKDSFVNSQSAQITKRGGRYNKKIAPPTPSFTSDLEDFHDDTTTIKAILLLRPATPNSN